MANTETDPIRQIVMMYDGAIKFLSLTAIDIDNGDFVAKSEHSNRALEIVMYLQSILDFDKGGDVAVNLDRLYRSITAMVLQASARSDAAMMRKAGELLAPVRDAWQVNAGAAVASYEAAPQAAGLAMVG